MFRNILFVSFFFIFANGWTQDPTILYLSWRADPARTMTLTWKEGEVVYYKQHADAPWQEQKGQIVSIDALTLHRAELTGLEPDTTYLFRIDDGAEHKFRTLPEKLDRAVKVAMGGDAYFTPEINERMNRQVASHDPDFVILAGDIAYTEGVKCALRSRSWKIERWQQFFRAWSRDMVTEDGRLIPIMPVIGNHDIREGFDCPFREKVFFYQFFVFPTAGIPYQVLKIGEDLCFYLLDSGHSFPIGGGQTEWLEMHLRENSAALFHIPIYHIAAYPSVTSFTHRGAKDIRKFWTPLFEKYGVRVSMENDNHSFKRTYPIKEGKIDSDGVYYLGDGAWGVPPKKPHTHWYLAKALKSNNFWLATVTRSKCLFQAYNLQGELLDELDILPGKHHGNHEQ